MTDFFRVLRKLKVETNHWKCSEKSERTECLPASDVSGDQGRLYSARILFLRKKMRNYRCSLYWFEHLVVSRFIHPSVILSFVSLIYRGLSPVYKWGNLNLWKLKQLKILYQTFWFKHRKKQVIKINSQWVETLHIYNMDFLYRYNLRTWLQYWILVVENSTSCL